MSDTRDLGPVVFMMGEHVYLRPIEMSDIPHVQRWINEPQTRRFLLNVRPLNEIAEKKWVEMRTEAADDFTAAIVTRDGDRYIGNTGLHRIDPVHRCAIFGLVIGDPEYRGKGLGTEVTRLVVKHAFETLNLNRVELDVFDFNVAGIRTYEKAGFTREGTLREHHFRDGRYCNVHRYGILAREYFHHAEPRGAA